MRYCNTEIHWSDSDEPVVCKVSIDDDEDACDLHTKYLTEDEFGEGPTYTKRWRSTPSPWDRKRENDRTTRGRYITRISNSRMGVSRPIHDENTD